MGVIGSPASPSPEVARLWEVLAGVLDPEVPVLSVVDLGIVRGITVDETGTEVTVTPTYSGCPAIQVIENDIRAALERAGADRPRIRTVFAPAWTSDWIAPAAREKLRAYGIAPPLARTDDGDPLVQILSRRAPAVVPCPWCGHQPTELRSAFGPTACKAIRYCPGCQQPFEAFKTI